MSPVSRLCLICRMLPTKEQIESAMVEEMRSMFEEELLNDIVVRSSSWGDLEATESENDLYLIVSFPPEHRDYLRGVCQLGDSGV